MSPFVYSYFRIFELSYLGTLVRSYFPPARLRAFRTFVLSYMGACLLALSYICFRTFMPPSFDFLMQTLFPLKNQKRPALMDRHRRGRCPYCHRRPCRDVEGRPAAFGFVSLDWFFLGRSRVVSVGSSIAPFGPLEPGSVDCFAVDLRVSCVQSCGSLGDLSCDSIFGSWSAHKCGHG